MRAFADPAVRADVLARLDVAEEESQPLIASRRIAGDGELAEFAALTGLAPSFILLARALPSGDVAPLKALLSAVPEGADTRPVAHLWVADLWSRAGGEASPELKAAAERFLVLNARAAAGDDAPAPEWRAVRRALTAASGGKGIGALLAAGAWSPSLAPGAIADVAQAKAVQAMQVARDEAGWTEEHSTRREEYYDRLMERAAEEAGPNVQNDIAWRETEEGRAWSERFEQAFTRLQEEVVLDVPDVEDALTRHMKASADDSWARLIAVAAALEPSVRQPA